MFESAILRAPVKKVRIADGARTRIVRIYRLRFNQTVRLVVRQRAEHYGVDHAEHGSVRTDSECQGNHGDNAEAETLAQLAQSVAQVLQHSSHDSSPIRGVLFAPQRNHGVDLGSAARGNV